MDGATSTLVEIPLEGEGSDRAFLGPGGHRFRVRIRRQDERVTRPAPNVPVTRVAPTQTTLCLSLALLDDDNQVVRVGERYRIFDAHEILLSQEMMATPGFDVRSMIENVIARRIAAAEKIIESADDASSYLSGEWGLS